MHAVKNWEIDSFIARKLLALSNFLDGQSPQQLPDAIADAVARATQHGAQIRFVLPAFPAKSANREKTHSFAPDLGEVRSLTLLNEVCRLISAQYSPGAILTICSDGRVFNDLVGVSDPEVSAYSRELRTIVQDFSLEHIGFFDLEDVFPIGKDFKEMREDLATHFGNSINQIRERIVTDPNALNLFNGIHRFLKEDFLVLYPHLSKNKNSLLAKETAYKVIQRSDAWSALVKRHFPTAVRLSIHPQPLKTEKFPIRLLPGNDQWGTPWHRVPLMRNDALFLIRHEEAIQNRFTLKLHLGKYAYFEASEVQ